MLAKPKNETGAESLKIIGVPTPGIVRNFLGAMGIHPSHQLISPSAIEAREGLVFSVSNCANSIGWKLLGRPGT